ncbi:hypothetical protein AALO_G00219270 [Alosa alosa]|uniref:Uncharacterized protein n=1 Tax=Alosa alosa TaxID=278164 RepID=A0AAV6G0P8_9TELE|nr:hypothetical protein AALO_G00219270 [Alosa alosa]
MGHAELDKDMVAWSHWEGKESHLQRTNQMNFRSKGLGFLPHISHDRVQQPAHHIPTESLQQSQQFFKQRALERCQAACLCGPHGPQHLVTKSHSSLLQLQEELRENTGVR